MTSCLEALRDILSKPHQLPRSDIENLRSQVMAFLWTLEVERICALHPGVAEGAQEAVEAIHKHYDAGGSEDDCPEYPEGGTEYMHAATEAHSWALNGCPWHEFAFPAFFGTKIPTYVVGADGIARPTEEP